MADLVSDYLAGRAEALQFFAAPPALPAQLPSPAPLAPDLVAALRSYQSHLGLTRSITGQEHVVVTGQQPGLLTGPLYTIYKAITTIQAAQQITLQTGQPCLPIFWIGGDDHDFEEMREAHVLSRQHELLTLRYTPQADVGGLPMFRIPLEQSLHSLVDEAAAAVPGSEFSEEVHTFLHDTLAASANFSEWFARILARLFRDTPLLLFTPELAAARTLATPVFQHEIEHPLSTTTHVNAAAAALRAAGYAVQLEKHAEECGFFLFEAGRRRKVIFRTPDFQLPETGTRYTAAELRERLACNPEDFSANVAVRCIVQQALLRPDVYVAGPGEVAYWAQFRAVFAEHQQAMPVVYPRAQAVLTSLKLNKLLRKHGLHIPDLTAGEQTVLDQVLLRAEASPALRALRQHRDRILETLSGMREAMQQAQSATPLAAMTDSFVQQTQQHLERLELAAAHGDARQVETVHQQVRRLCASLAPQRKPQERVYSIFSFLFEHGFDLIPRLIHQLNHTPHGMQEVEL